MSGTPRKDYGWATREGADRAEYAVLARWVPEGARVLDVGCGDGRLGASLAATRRAKVSGLEIDPAGVEKAARAGLDAREGDADTGLPWPADAFDVALMNVTLHMVVRPGFVFDELLRVAPVVLVSFPNVAHAIARVQLLAGRFPAKPLYGYAWWESRHLHLFSWADFLALAASRGARVTASEHFGRDGLRPSRLARAWPNLFASICLARLERGPR